jgi:autotransporter-associated beta strand protein
MSTLQTFRRHRKPLGGALAALMAVWQIGQPLQAVDNNWLGTSADWTDGSNWSSTLAPIASDSLIFGSAPPTKAITLGAGSVGNSLSFLDNYTLNSNDLTLGSGSVRVSPGYLSVINSTLSGTGGLNLSGGGGLRLTSTANDFTGTTTLAGGTLVISDAAQLGDAASAIKVTITNPLAGNTSVSGFVGGTLLLDGSAGPVSLGRAVDLEGSGANGRGAALLSLRNNEISGLVRTSTGNALRSTRISSINGTLTLSGGLNVLGTAGTTFATLGGANSAAAGNFNLTGPLTGTGTLEKSGSGTLFLNSSTAAGFTGNIRVSGSNTVGQSSVRIGTLAAVGGAAGGTTNSAFDMNGGVLEVRSDSSITFAKNVYQRANSTIYTGPAAGGSAINGISNFGVLHAASNTTMTFNSRNGYGVTFTGATTQENSNNNLTWNNNMGGTLSFTAGVWPNNEAGTARTLTIGGNGNTTITGSLLATGTAKTLAKTGSGLLTIIGSAAAAGAGPVTVQGSLAITDFRSISPSNANTDSITLGNTTTTAGNLIIGTTVAGSAPNMTTLRPIILNGTTANNAIYANNPGSTGVTLSGAFTKPVAGTSSLILGGTNTSENLITSALPVSGTGGLIKNGPGLWALSGANQYTGSTTITRGTLRLKASTGASDIILSGAGNTIVFNADSVTQDAGGEIELRGVSGAATTETLGALTPTAGAGTVRITGSGGASASLVFTSVGAVGKGAGVNFITTAGTGGTITLTGVAETTATTLPGNGHFYINGTDFARVTGTGGLVVAPVYGTDAGFVIATTGTAMTAASHNSVTSAIAAQPSVGVTSLRLGANLTMSPNSILTVNTGGVANDGGILAAANSTIATSGTGGITSGGGGTLVFAAPTGVTLTLNAPIMSTSTGGFTKNGAGVLIFGAANAQTGASTINEGVVRLATGGALSGASTTTDLAIRQGATLDVNGVSTGTSIRSLNGSGSIVNGMAGTAPGAATVQVGNNNGTGTFTGIISNGTGGALSVTKLGTGAMSWLGNNTYTGVTTIGSTGIVTVNTMAIGGTASGIGASSSDAANLVFNGTTGGLNYAGGLLNGSLAVGSRSATTDRLFTLAGTGASAGVTLQSNAALNNAITWTSTGAIVHAGVNPQTVILGGASTGDNTFNPQLTDSGTGTDITSLTKNDAGQWNLGNSANTYTGTTRVSAGILGLNNNGALPINSPLVLGNAGTTGVIQMSGTLARNLSATPTAGTGTLTFGGTGGSGGFAAHATPLTVTLDGGALTTWGTGGFVGTGGAAQTLILGSTTALSDVTFTNPINLNGAARTVTVNDNGDTGADFATLSGALSSATGTGSLVKAGAGLLQLTSTNSSYTGTTAVNAGGLAVVSLGNTATPGNTSVGLTSSGTSGAVLLGTGATGATLVYIGSGETSDRMIRITSTGGGAQIHADGSGPLILTNVLNDLVGDINAKTLNLRGSNTAGNRIDNVLTNSGTALTVTVDGGATWILNNANTYTGPTNVNAGALGVGNNAALGAGTIALNNGNMFAFGADRTLANAVTQANNTTTGFFGDYSLTFGNVVSQAGANNWQTNNNIIAGKQLTFGNWTADSITANRTWTFDGSGTTEIGNFTTTSTGFGVPITKNGNGTLILSGTGGGVNNFNRNNSAVTVNTGTLKLGANEVIGDGFDSQAVPVAYGGVTIANTSTAVSATFDLNGKTETINALTATSAGTAIIDNSSASPATLTFGAANATVVFGTGGVGNYSITQSGGGAINLTKTGTGNANFTGTLGNTGTVTGNGGVLNINSVSVATGAVANGGTINFKSGFTTPANLTTVTTDNGGLVSFADGAGTPFDNLATLNLSLTANAALELDAGDSGTDTLTAITAAVGNVTTLFIKDVDLSNLTTYDLILNAGGGLGTSANYSLSLAGYTGSTLSVTSTAVRLNVGTLNLTDMYWAGATSPATTAWSTIDGGGNTNFSDDVLGTVLATALPGKGQKVIFQADNITGGAPLATTLEQAFTIGSLEFRPSATAANTSRTISIAPGAVSSNSLTIRGSDGINLTAGASGSVTISAPLVAAVDQTWTVADAPVELLAATSSAGSATFSVTSTAGLTPGMALTGSNIPAGITIVSMTPTTITMSGTATTTSTAGSFLGNQQLNVTGALTGSGDVTKAGPGTVVLSGANGNLTGAYINNAGRTLVNTLSALGGQVGIPGSGTDITVTGGAFLYNNATAGTFVNDITLNGGTLSAGGAAHTYSGGINVTANSTINMRDLATSTTFGTTSRAITLSGVVTGSSAIEVDSVTTASNGNQVTGNLVLNNASSTWNGDLNMTRGKVFFQNAAGAGNLTPYFGYNGVINFNQFGAVEYRNIDGGTLNRTAAINFASSAVGELVVNNLDALASNYTLTQSGLISLNGTSVARIFLADAASNLIISGGISLNGNASFSVAGGDADSLVTITGTGFTGTGNLAINDEQGAWNQTSSRLQIDAASTFTGNTTLNEGILILGNKDALSTGSLTITGASTIQASVGLTGANSVANVLNLGATLTTSGTNSLEFSGNVNNSVDANRTLTNNIASPALLTLSGAALNLAPVTGTAAYTLTLSGTGSTTISAAINDGSSFANGLTVTSSGTTTLSGANTYNGLTTMNQATGILRLQGSNTGTGGTTLTAGTLQLDSASNGGLASGTLTLTAGTLTAASTARSFSNNTLLTAVTLAGDQSITLTGTVTNNAGNRTLTNNLTSPAVGTLAGNVFLSEGGTARTLTISGTGDTNITGLIANSSTGAGAAGVLAKSGVGTLTLSSTGNSYTGGTTINLGTVRTTANNVIPNTGTVTVNATSTGTALLDLNGNSDTIGALNLGGTGGVAGAVNQVTTGAGTLTLGGNVTVTTTGNWTSPAEISGTLALGGTSRTFTVNDSTGTDVDLDLKATVTGTANNSVTKAGAGVLLMTSTGGTWGGGTVVSAGEIRLGASNVIPNTGTVTLNGGGSSILNLNGFNDTIAALTLGGTGNGAGSVYQVNTGAGTLTLGGTVTVNSTTNNTGSVISGNIALGASRTFAISNSPAAVDLDLTATVTGTATASFTKSGDGVLAISSTGNSWGGGTVVSAGELRSGNSNVIPDTGTVTLSGSGSSVLNLNGFSDTIGALTLGGTGNAAGSVYQVNTGAGTLTLGGTLSVTSTANTVGSVISGNLDLGANRIIDVANSPALADLTVSALVSGAFTLNKTGAGVLLLSNASNSYSGATTISGGIISIAADTALGTAPGVPTAGHLTLNGGGLNTSSTMTLATNRGITLGASGGALLPDLGTTLTVDSAIDGVGGLLLNGTGGDLILSGADSNTYAGVTTVTAGTLTLSKTGGALAIANPVTGSKVTPNILVNGGTLVWGGDDQIGDNSFINVTSGTVNFNNRNETLFNLANSGGSINYGTGDITIEDPIWSAGSNTVSGNTTFGFLDISGGTNNVTGTSGGGVGQLTIGTATTSGPLTFSGSNNTPTLNLNSDDTTAGRLRFRAGSSIELQFTGTGTSTGLIASTGVGANAGEVDLNGSTRTFNIGDAAGSTIDMTISAKIVGAGAGITKTGAGTLSLSGNNTYDGGTNLNAGVVQVNSAGALGSTGTISFAGGTLQYTAANTTDYSARFSSAASQAISIDTNGQNVIFASNLTSSGGSLAKTGAGTLELTGANTYDLGTTVGAGGALLINNTTGSATGTGDVTTPTLGGSGSIVSSATIASVVVQSILNVGNVGDTGGQDLAINLTGGSSSINLSGAALNFDLWTDFTSGSSNAFPASDLLNLSAGSINITGGTLNVSALANVGNTWAFNTAWQLFNWNAVAPTGTFSTLNLPDLTTWDALAEWDTSNLYTTGTIQVILVPEPSRAMLLLLGLLSLGFRRRRSRF